MNTKERNKFIKKNLTKMLLSKANVLTIADRKTCKLIFTCINDSAKFREFDCIFDATSKQDADAFSIILSSNLGYKDVRVFNIANCWSINAIKSIIADDLIDTLIQAKEESIKNNCLLIDYNIDVDIRP